MFTPSLKNSTNLSGQKLKRECNPAGVHRLKQAMLKFKSENREKKIFKRNSNTYLSVMDKRG